MRFFAKKHRETTRHDQNNIMYGAYGAGDITVVPRKPFEQVDEQEVCQRLEVDHYVKRAPTLLEQVSRREDSRENVVRSVLGKQALLSRGIAALSSSQFREQTERQTISDLHTKLIHYSKAAMDKAPGNYRRINEIRHTLNYIGEIELAEASAGIAAYWKYRLLQHPDKALFILLGEINRMDITPDYAAPAGKVKSDEYLMDRIIAHFSDEELKQFADRLLVNESQLANWAPEKVDVIMLDDWAITGTEMRDQYRQFILERDNLAFRNRVEMQFVIATKERLQVGFEPRDIAGAPWLPTRAYFIANETTHS